MMARLTSTLIIAAALIATAGCAKKRPEVLPPNPGDAGAYDPNAGGGVGVQPGSREDFLQSVLADTVNFALDQYGIDGRAQQILDSQAQWLARYPNVRITLEGHCDERGTREYNLALGDRRANAAANYLAARGVSPTRITTISYGKERPISLSSNEQAWAQNRRAVTIVLQ